MSCPVCGSDDYEYSHGFSDGEQQLEPGTGYCPTCYFIYSQHVARPENEQVRDYERENPERVKKARKVVKKYYAKLEKEAAEEKAERDCKEHPAYTALQARVEELEKALEAAKAQILADVYRIRELEEKGHVEQDTPA